jgi:hypothetical protein
MPLRAASEVLARHNRDMRLLKQRICERLCAHDPHSTR